MGVLENGIPFVVIEFPARSGNHFTVAIEGFVGGDEVEYWWCLIRDAVAEVRHPLSVPTRLADFSMQRGAKAGLAGGELDETIGGDFGGRSHKQKDEGKNLTTDFTDSEPEWPTRMR